MTLRRVAGRAKIWIWLTRVVDGLMTLCVKGREMLRRVTGCEMLRRAADREMLRYAAERGMLRHAAEREMLRQPFVEVVFPFRPP